MSNTSRLNYIFNTMKQRCYDTECRKYKNYGARGVVVCKEWLNPKMVNTSKGRWSEDFLKETMSLFLNIICLKISSVYGVRKEKFFRSQTENKVRQL